MTESPSVFLEIAFSLALGELEAQYHNGILRMRTAKACHGIESGRPLKESKD